MHPARKIPLLVFLGAFGLAARIGAQDCATTEFEAKKVIFVSDVLPIQKMGFFPYTFSGTNPPAKYTTESWTGSGDYSAGDIFTGTTTHYTNIQWSGGWSFSATTGAETSNKALSYHVTGPFGLNEDRNFTQMKLGLGAAGSLSPTPEVLSPVSRRYVGPGSGASDTRNVNESLTGSVSLEDAVAYGEAHKTTDANSLQYWNNFPSADAVQAAIAVGPMTRVSPLQAHARRVKFSAQFCVPCIGQGKFLITYYYKRWAIGQAEPAEFTTRTEEKEFKEPPYVIEEQPYHFELKQGEQCVLVKVTARPVEDCARREPGAASGQVKSVDMLFFLGRRSDGAGAGALSVTGSTVSAALHTPAALRFIGTEHADVELITNGGGPEDPLRQVKAPEAFVDIVTLSASSYELRFYRPSQVGALSGGLYTVTGQPFVTHLVDNPGGAAAVRFTETRSSQTKVTNYSSDSATGTITMTSGNGLRSEALQKTTAGNTITETRTIRDAASQVVSVVREVKTVYPFGEVVTARTLDPAGANLTTTTTYYTNAATDGGAYGQVKLVAEPYGRWTRYTYDAQGRVATTVTQFLDAVTTALDDASRVTAVTYGTIADQDGDSLPEELTTTVESLLGQEVGRSYEVRFSQLGTAFGADAETVWNIQCTVAGAAWNAATNLVTKRRTIDSGIWFGKPVSELRPDGTLTTYSYAADSTTLTTTSHQGAANGAGTTVTDGTRTVLVETLLGKMVSRDVYDYPSNTLLTSELVTETDAFGRPTRVDFQDGTYELRSYACCGLDMMTDRQGIATNYLYNDLGQVDRESRAGIAHERTLDPDGRLLTSTRIGSDNSEIITESHDYDVAGRLVWSKDALNRQTNFTEALTGGHLVRTTTNPDGGTVIRTHYKDGSLLSVTGTAAPQRLSYEYGVDADGAFTKEIRVGSGGETGEWTKTYTDVAGRAYKRVYADTAVETSHYNAVGQIVRQVDADGVTTLFAYNAKGEQEVTAVDLNANNTIDYTVDRITKTVSTVATRDTYTVQRNTTQIWETDAADTPVAVVIAESTMGGLRSWQTNRGLMTTSVTTLNGSGGRTVTMTAPDGTTSVQTFANDRLSSLVTSHSSLGQLSSVTYSYDPHGRLLTQTDARNGATSYAYFNDDQVMSVTTPDPDTAQSGTGYDAQVTSFGYDTAGRQNLVTQPDGTAVNTTYWPTGAIKRTWGSRTYPVEYTYDSQGRVKTLTTWKDFTGNTGTAVTTWNYTTDRGFLLNKRYADNTGPAYTYKPSGRLLTRTWVRTPTITTTYGYNAAGDPDSVNYSDATTDVSMTYDRAGRLKARTDASGTCTWTYDAASGQLKDEDYTAGALSGLGVRRSYDSLFRIESLSALSASSVLNPVSFDYDDASRLEAVTAGTNTATYGYVPNSPLIGSVTFKQGGATRLTTTKVYDKLNRLSGITNTSSLSPLPSVQYQYNSANQRTRATREDSTRWDYGYDALGQVNSAVKKLASGDPISGFGYGYTYDDIGNRKTATLNTQTSTYTANNLNQYASHTVLAVMDVFGTATADSVVTVNGQAVNRQDDAWHLGVATGSNAQNGIWKEFTVAGVRAGQGPGGSDAVAVGKRSAWLPKTPEVFSHDADGNLTGDGRWAYTWDGENRLIAMETRIDILPPLGQFPLTERRKLEFSYDSVGRRFAKKVSTWNGSGWTLAAHTKFLYDGWNLIAELSVVSGQSSVVRTYAWGLDLSGSFQGAGGVGGLLAVSLSNGSLHAACYDGNGNVIGLVDMATGAKSATYEYNALGETLIAEGPAALANIFRFSTKYTEAESGLLYYGLRYYNANAARWLSRDPVAELDSANLYAMVGNDSVNWTDYIGQWKLGIHKQITEEAFSQISCTPCCKKEMLAGLKSGSIDPDIPDGYLGTGSFFVDVESGIFSKEFLKKVYGKGLSYRSHYGDLQWWHSMQNDETEARAIQQKMIGLVLDRAFAFKVNRDDGDCEAAGRVFGAALHTVEDSFSKSHTLRDQNWAIQRFQNYGEQDSSKHGVADKDARSVEYKHAVRAVRKLLEIVVCGKGNVDELRSLLENDLLKLSHGAAVGGTLPSYQRSMP